MSQELVVEIATQTLYYTMLIGAPVLITGLVIGILLSIVQSVVQIKEMTLTFIPCMPSPICIVKMKKFRPPDAFLCGLSAEMVRKAW